MSKPGFPAAARRELADTQMRQNVDKATSTIRTRRAARVAEVPDWEALRDAGAGIKARAMAPPSAMRSWAGLRPGTARVR